MGNSKDDEERVAAGAVEEGGEATTEEADAPGANNDQDPPEAGETKTQDTTTEEDPLKGTVVDRDIKKEENHKETKQDEDHDAQPKNDDTPVPEAAIAKGEDNNEPKGNADSDEKKAPPEESSPNNKDTTTTTGDETPKQTTTTSPSHPHGNAQFNPMHNNNNMNMMMGGGGSGGMMFPPYNMQQQAMMGGAGMFGSPFGGGGGGYGGGGMPFGGGPMAAQQMAFMQQQHFAMQQQQHAMMLQHQQQQQQQPHARSAVASNRGRKKHKGDQQQHGGTADSPSKQQHPPFPGGHPGGANAGYPNPMFFPNAFFPPFGGPMPGFPKGPHHNAGSFSSSTGICLSLQCDHEHLSDYQMAIRHNLELFQATKEDCDSNTQGRKRPVVLGQIGLRCRHCAGAPLRSRGRGAVYYPAKLTGIYQAAQNMAQTHLTTACQHIPVTLKDELRELRQRRDNASGGKQYWADGVRALGVYETEESGLKLKNNNSNDIANSGTPITKMTATHGVETAEAAVAAPPEEEDAPAAEPSLPASPRRAQSEEV